MASTHSTGLPTSVTVGAVFGLRTVLRLGSIESLCRCSCGSESLVRNSFLLRGRSTQCHGCANKRVRHGRRVMKSDLSKQLYLRLSATVRNAIRRCTDETCNVWKYYGARGIKVCPEWTDDPGKFLTYLTTLPGHDDPTLVIDRIENNVHYEPGNVKFSTRSESLKNRRAWKWA